MIYEITKELETPFRRWLVRDLSGPRALTGCRNPLPKRLGKCDDFRLPTGCRHGRTSILRKCFLICGIG
ncbi:hypothetical protein CBS63078_4837 [Aspergillus niger]|nr:hypothetical protein CBS12448_1665 [Aspergillus niger]KAI2894569.1 hypothetical protein CBS13152_4134 [Aspergillus niger]KAI2907246.1 hypothetical protein CBS63078_4837 [Aspergillus niger]KAI2919439.1 hypothetical protein CBS147320_8566 [Aspergillus niger]KAI2936807.1 hypothetical protein CBS147321_8264 [Aspergillus niger]